MQAFYYVLNGDGILNKIQDGLRTSLAAATVLLMLTVSLAAFASPASAALTSVWTDATPMGGPRTFPAVVQDDDGLAYVMGGVVNGTSWDSTPLANSYDTATGAWATLAPMPKGLRWHSGALGADGKVYVLAGHNDTDGTLYAPVQIYDPESDSWSTGAAIPTRVAFAPAVTLGDGKIYVIGGRDTSSTAVDLVQVYDPVADSWSTTTALPSARFGGTAVEWRGYIFYAGGYVGGVPSSEAVIRYPGGSWGTLGSMPEALIFPASALGQDGCWYVMGGGNEGNPSDDSYMYDIYTDSWTELPRMGLGVTYVTSAVSAPDGRVLVLGGTNYSLSIRASDRVQSLQVMTKSITLSATSVSQGGSVLVTVAYDFAFKTAVSYSLDCYILAGGVIYSPIVVSIPVPGTFAFVVDIPQQLPAGSNEIVLNDFTVDYDSGGWTFDTINLPLTVVSAPSVEDQLLAIQQQLAVLQAMLNVPGANLTSLAIEAAILQAKLDGIIAGLGVMGASSSTMWDQLNVTFAALQQQLDDFQEQIDRVENKADTAGTYGLVTMVLVIIIIILAALMVMMARKKP